MTPQPNIIYLWRQQDTPNNSRTNPEVFFKDVIVGHLKVFEETGTDKSRRYVLHFWKTLHMGSISANISQKTLNDFLNLWNFETLKQRTQETTKPRNQYTEKPINQETKKR